MEKNELDIFRNNWILELNPEELTSNEYDVTEKTDVQSLICDNNDKLLAQKPEADINSTEKVFPTVSCASPPCCMKSDRKEEEDEEWFPAFNIANTYLKLNAANCRYCNVRDRTTDSPPINCTCNLSNNTLKHNRKKKHSHTNSADLNVAKRSKNTKFDRELYFKKHFGSFPQCTGNGNSTAGEEKESLLDVLIADIDEITCIPFFDIDLPREIAVKIFQWLPITDLASCRCVNSKWKLLAEDDLIWFSLCEELDVERGVERVADRQHWNQYVKGCILVRRRVQGKWKERCCEVRDLGSSEDVICTASTFNNHIATSYLDGSIKLWELHDGRCGENLKEKCESIEDVVLFVCSCIHLNRYLCVAGFENGDVMVWRRDEDLSGHLVFVHNYDSKFISFVQGSSDGYHFVVSFHFKFVLIGASDNGENQWNWSRKFENDVGDKICKLILASTVLSPVTMITSTSTRLTVDLCDGGNDDGTVMLDQLTGATISSLDYKNSFVVAGISGFGYSILEGYRIRKYCIKTGKQVGNIIGSQTAITCLNYADCYGDQVVIGCADCSIRIHDFKGEILLAKISGIDSTITSIQMDKWKAMSGHQNGTVCLWDRFHGTMYWQSRPSKHPVCIGKFNEQLVVSVSIPEDKFQARIDYCDETRKQCSIRVMDFTKENITLGVPDACRAEYDDIAGYDYNIQLIAPYDDVQTLRLPKI